MQYMSYCDITADVYEEKFYEIQLKQLSCDDRHTEIDHEKTYLPKCYYYPCCSYKGIVHNCKIGVKDRFNDQFKNMLMDTEFECLLYLSER